MFLKVACAWLIVSVPHGKRCPLTPPRAAFSHSALAPAYELGGAVFRTGTPASLDDLVCDFGTSGLRLPTAAEWEFAARGGLGGTPSTYPGGNTLEDLGCFAGNSEGAIQPAGGKTANGLGLFDLAGNAAEWTWDAPSAAPAQHLVRGGSWSSFAVECALDALTGANPALPSGTIGFRLARSVSLALTGALDQSGLVWETGGEHPWFAQTATTHDGEDAAGSGEIGENEESWMETTVAGPGVLTFHWKSLAIGTGDVVRFYLNSTEEKSLSGDVNWEEETFEIPEGETVLRWVFTRSSVAGASRVWVDALSFSPRTEVEFTDNVYESPEVTILSGDRQRFRFSLDGPRQVSLSTTGEDALRAELFDSEDNLIASFTGEAGVNLEELLLAGEYELHLFREADGGPAQTFTLTIDATTIAASRPDLAVGASPVALSGAGLYAPASQAAGLLSSKAGAVTGYASLSNRGNLPDVLAASATGGSAFFAVSYFGPEGNITAGLLSGTYRTAELSEGIDPVVIRASITPNKKKLTKKKKGKKPKILRKTHVLSLRVKSTSDPALSDAAVIRVQTK